METMTNIHSKIFWDPFLSFKYQLWLQLNSFGLLALNLLISVLGYLSEDTWKAV